MKRPLLSFLILLSLLHGTSEAQNFASEEATWHYDNWQALTFFGDGYVKIVNAGDTVIDSYNSVRLEITKYEFNAFQNQNDTIRSIEYVRQSNDSVFCYRFNEFWLLYDFGASAGDTWEIPGNAVCASPGVAVVDSIGEMVVNGQTVRWLNITSPQVSSVAYTHHMIIERIGSLGYMFPEPYCATDSDIGGRLRCFADENIDTLLTDFECESMSFVGIQESIVSEPQVYPNPATDHIWYKLPDDVSNVQLELIDLSGKQVLALLANSAKTRVDITELKAGIYVLKTINGQRTISTHKIVKQ